MTRATGMLVVLGPELGSWIVLAGGVWVICTGATLTILTPLTTFMAPPTEGMAATLDLGGPTAPGTSGTWM